MNSKRRIARLDALEQRVPPREPGCLEGIDLELLTNEELDELERAALLFDRHRTAQAGLSSEQRAELRERIRQLPNPPFDYAGFMSAQKRSEGGQEPMQ